MSLHLVSLNSGSNGNSYYVGNEEHGVLIDAGISCKTLEYRMKSLNLPIHRIRGVFITHEHGDHIGGLSTLAFRHHIPVYASEGTIKELGSFKDKIPPFVIQPETPVILEDLTITGFKKYHDAADPLSFIVSHSDKHIGIFTDIGTACTNLRKYFSICHAVLLESNYDEEMLQNGKYPEFLKSRIRGDNGHLSNSQALELFLSCKADHLEYLCLGHLSKENNHPDLVRELFEKHAKGIKIEIANRYGITEPYFLTKEKANYNAPTGQLRLEL
jgi:phosphoribosyl 1,2-cyclic phosphodiesterase